MRFLKTSLALFFFTFAATAQTPQLTGIKVLDYGIYTVNIASTLNDSPQGIAVHNVSNVRLAEQTRTVKMQHGVHFGFHYTLLGSPSGATVPLRLVVLYPPPGVRPPNSTAPLLTAEADLTANAIGPTLYSDYSFDNDWELVPGQWTLQLWSGNQQLTSQSFNVVP